MKTTIANPVNTTNAMGKKRKRPKNMHKSKKDEENILSKDIEDDNIRYMMDTKKNLKPREDLKSTFTLKTLRFKPQKYKGSFLPYHLRWIFNNNVKSNEIVLLNEIESLENEINRLKALKLLNRECRKLAGLPFGITTNFCQCCHLLEKKKHDCSHKYCNDNCPRKKAEELMNNLLKNNKLKELKENIAKDKNMKKLFSDFNNNNINFSEQKKNDINNISSNNEQKIMLDKNLKYNNNENNINDSNKMNNTPTKKRLIFGTVERSSIEKRSIFLVKSDNMNDNNNSGIYGNESSNIKNDNKSNNNDSEEGDDENNNNNNNKEDDDNEEEEDELKNYTVSIENDGDDDELEEMINIKNDNDEENDNNKNNEGKNENDSDNNNDKDNDEDDVIIINQTSPHHSDKEN